MDAAYRRILLPECARMTNGWRIVCGPEDDKLSMSANEHEVEHGMDRGLWRRAMGGMTCTKSGDL